MWKCRGLGTEQKTCQRNFTVHCLFPRCPCRLFSWDMWWKLNSSRHRLLNLTIASSLLESIVPPYCLVFHSMLFCQKVFALYRWLFFLKPPWCFLFDSPREGKKNSGGTQLWQFHLLRHLFCFLPWWLSDARSQKRPSLFGCGGSWIGDSQPQRRG